MDTTPILPKNQGVMVLVTAMALKAIVNYSNDLMLCVV
jgi:hypothetical protein